jgi:hypothetical protein
LGAAVPFDRERAVKVEGDMHGAANVSAAVRSRQLIGR